MASLSCLTALPVQRIQAARSQSAAYQTHLGGLHTPPPSYSLALADSFADIESLWRVTASGKSRHQIPQWGAQCLHGASSPASLSDTHRSTPRSVASQKPAKKTGHIANRRTIPVIPPP